MINQYHKRFHHRKNLKWMGQKFRDLMTLKGVHGGTRAEILNS